MPSLLNLRSSLLHDAATMTSLISSLLLAASILSGPQPTQKQPSLLDSLKQFEGHWKGIFALGSIKMDVDLTWKPFAGRWAEVSYTYTTPKMKLEYRVMVTPNPENKGFNIWMFGDEMPTPDLMTGVMEGKTLNVIHNRQNEPDVKFSIDAQKNLVIRVVSSVEKDTEIGHAALKKVKE